MPDTFIMTITPHILVGAAVASALTSNVYLAFLLGFLTHFVLDAIPHIDPGTYNEIDLPFTKKDIKLESVHGINKPWPVWIYTYAFAELIIIWTIVILLFRSQPNFWVIVAGGIGGIFVDVIDNPLVRFHLKWPVFRQIDWLHHKLHYDLPVNKWYWGVLIQLIIIGGSLWFLLKKF